MSTPPEPVPDVPPARPGRARRWWQVGLRTVFLLVAAVAVWMTHALDRREIATLEGRIARARPLARELDVDDDRQIAVVKLEELWYDENRWDLYLPEGRRYRLCLATRGIDDDNLPRPASDAPIRPGRHVIALEQQQDGDSWHLIASRDGTPIVSADEPASWHSDSSSGGGNFPDSTQRPADAPLILFRRRFSRADALGRSWTAPDGPIEGILLWVEPEPPPAGPSPPGR